MLLFSIASTAQTVLISPTGDGGFESGPTLASNNWLFANSSTDKWTTGTAPVVFAGTSCAYISSAVGEGGAWAYSQLSVIQHLYRDFTVPAGENVGVLNFKWKARGEGGLGQDFDNLKVFLAPTSVTPTANLAIPAVNQIAGFGSISGFYNNNSAAYNDGTINFPLVPGTTYRLIFSWKSDFSDLVNPPAALDDISLTSRPAGSAISTAIGGLWSSPATWVGGVVPGADDAQIADGAIVTINQPVIVRNLTVGQGGSGILQWNAAANTLTASGNIVVSEGANLNMFTSAASPDGVNVAVAGNFTNNGTVHAAYVGAFHTLINFNSPAASPNQVLSGSGNFVGGIVSGLFFQNLGNNVINTSQNLTTRLFALTAGTLNTNGKLSISNTAQFYGQAINQQVYQVAVTNMGTGYNTATPPTITLAAPTGAGIIATAVPNIDDVTGTLRSITITNAGGGYRSNPVVTIAGGTGSGAAAVAVVNVVSAGNTVALTLKSGNVSITGGLNITSNQSVGAAFVTSGGVGYSAAPQVGFALPTAFLNLVTNGGTGYTATPTVTLSGGVALTGSANPTFTVVVAQGQVVSVIATGGGTLWQVPPTLTLTGGGGAGATAEFPANSLATATASISNGMVNNFTITNPGFGYVAAPATGVVGGGFTTTATGTTSRVGLYNITMNWFIPQPSPAVHQDDVTIPANRRINNLTMSAGGLNLNSGLELYASAPIALTNGLINAGTNTIQFSHPAYAGTTGNINSNISGVIRLSTPGGSLTRTFPFDAPFVATTGTGSLATGSTVTSLTASRTAAPTGTVNPAGFVTGTRTYRIQSNAGATYGTNPTVTLNYNAADALVSDAASLFIGQSASPGGPWNVVSVSSGSGALPATGSRVTAIVAPGPIVPTGDDYYGWNTTSPPPITSVTSGDWNIGSTWNTGVVPVCSDNVQINATHNVTVNSAGNVSRLLVIAIGGTLTVASGDLTVGCTLNNNTLSNNGTLTVNGGVLNVNGNLAVATGSFFNQVGGDINVDGNAAGVALNSVGTGTFILSIDAANAANISLTGGRITVVDPHVALTNTVQVSLTVVGSINCGPAHTFRFGDGISTDAGSANGFQFYSWNGSGIISFGNVVLETVTGGPNRFVFLNGSFYIMAISGNLTINDGAELRQGGTVANGAIIVGGNITVNTGGTLTAPGFVYLGNATSLTATTLGFTPSTLAQTIGGRGTFRNALLTPTANFNTLTIDNTNASGATISNPYRVSAALNLTNGRLNTTPTNLLTVGVSGTAIGTMARTNGYVFGPLKKWYAATTGTATFPLGDGVNYKPAAVNFTTAPSTAGTLTANFSTVAPPFPNASQLTEGALIVNRASNQGSWIIDPADGLTGGNYTATFTGNGATDVIDFTRTVLIKRPTVGGDWVLDGTHVTATGSNAAPVVSRTGMTGFSEFAIGGELFVALPITVEYFRGTKQSNSNLLDWKVTCYNSPFVKMEVERSADGRNFKTIQTQTETALRCLQPFSYADTDPLAGINYYRLKSTDIDGKITYSATVAILNKSKGFEIVSMIPNPVETKAILSISSAVKSTMEIIVTDLAGKQLGKQRVVLIAGSNQVSLNLSNLAAGTYQVTGVTDEGERKTLRFIKQ